MEVYRKSSWLFLLLGVSLLSTALQGVQGEVESEGPSESECRPYIEKALKELETGETSETVNTPPETVGSSIEDLLAVDIKDDSDNQSIGEGDDDTTKESTENVDNNESVEGAPTSEQEGDTNEEQSIEQTETAQSDEENKEQEAGQEDGTEEASTETVEETTQTEASEEQTAVAGEQDTQSTETAEDQTAESTEAQKSEEEKATSGEEAAASVEEASRSGEEGGAESVEETAEQKDSNEAEQSEDSTAETASVEEPQADEAAPSAEEAPEAGSVEEQNETAEEDGASVEQQAEAGEEQADSVEEVPAQEESVETAETETPAEGAESVEDTKEAESVEDDQKPESVEETQGTESVEDGQTAESVEEAQADAPASVEQEDAKSEEGEQQPEAASSEEPPTTEAKSEESDDSKPAEQEAAAAEESTEVAGESETDSEAKQSDESGELVPEEDLILDIEIPEDLRDRDHVEQLLKLDDESSETENIINRISEITLRELKRLYENAIKPLEVLYKYRDLSNRHFGDAEIFSKPLILFMGPWSGGKSSIINYLTNNEYNETSLRTGAEPSPAYFNILMYGDEPEVIDGTELAADFTFSGLQKFGQGLEERLRGVKLNNKLLQKVNIVEIPGILEVRKQVSRVFPFNDACQWFIDRADIIFLVYDPSKLDVGPETEAILDQLKGREHQTRIILNKADQVKPEELMRVQGALIWNISPLMSSPQPPVMYTTSLWSRPYEIWAPVRLLQAQERAFLRDLRSAIDKRIENKIASARRFAVRVRNHAKMVDCYLTTYYNHKSVFGNRKQWPTKLSNIPKTITYTKGLSTLTNISRYDLPDPEVYKDFFKLNPLYEFQQLSATCTYFRGCPINRLDVAIAYDLPELVGTHRRLVENALTEANLASAPPGS